LADFRIWARVEHIGVKQFIAIASAVQGPPDDSRPIVIFEAAPTLAEAHQRKTRLAIQVGAQVRARGDRVVDVVAE
jgi:hypothetical protein